MGRNRIQIKFIPGPRKRYTTRRKRTAGFLKKAYELSVLAGVKISVDIDGEKIAFDGKTKFDTSDFQYGRLMSCGSMSTKKPKLAPKIEDTTKTTTTTTTTITPTTKATICSTRTKYKPLSNNNRRRATNNNDENVPMPAIKQEYVVEAEIGVESDVDAKTEQVEAEVEKEEAVGALGVESDATERILAEIEQNNARQEYLLRQQQKMSDDVKLMHVINAAPMLECFEHYVGDDYAGSDTFCMDGIELVSNDH